VADLIGALQIMMYLGGFLVMILFMVLVMHDPGGR
jgi:NADH-quinone oxidoreductase subunit J